MIRYFLLIILCALLTLSSIFAQQYNFRRYSIEEGLPRSGVYSLYEDSKGFLWIATEGGGVCVFDGENIKTYTTSDGLGHNTVRVVFEDNEGNMWFGTQGRGISKFNGKEFSIISENDGLSHNIVRSIAQDDNGDMWFGTFGGGVCKLNSREDSSGKLECFTTENGLGHNRVRALLKDSRGTLWLGTDGGLTRYDGRTFQNMSVKDGLPDERILCLFEDRSKNIWFGTRKGAVKYDGSKFTVYSTINGLIHNRIRAITQDNYGNMWFGTQAGISKFDGSAVFNYTEEEGLSNSRIRSMIMSSTGDIWVGTFFGGINMYSGDIFIHISENEGLSNNQVLSVYYDSNDNLWLGTYEGVNRVKLIDGKIKNIINYSVKDGMAGELVLCILQDNNNLWFGTDQGISIYNKSGFINIKPENGLSGGEVSAILKNTDNSFWIGTSEGLSLISFKGENRFFYEIKNFSENENFSVNGISSIYKDIYGKTWFGLVEDGFAVFNNNKFERYKLPGEQNNISSITGDNIGNVWLGTEGNGLFRYLNTNEPIDTLSFENYTTDDGLTSNTVYLISADNNENIWIGSEKGIDKISLTTTGNIQKIKFFGKNEGFIGIETNENAVCLDNANKIWFGTIKGATCYNPHYEIINTVESYTHITNLRLFFEELDWDNSIYCQGTGGRFRLPEELVLPHNKNHISFDFVGINLKMPLKVMYSWKLEGFDRDWTLPANKHDVSYTNLPHGDFTFLVRSSNDDGLWNKEPASFTFTIKAPFWKTWWFYLICIVFIFSIIVLYIKIREQKLVREKRILEEKVVERTAEVVQQKEEIEAQRDEIEAQRNLVTDQRDRITKQNQELTDSIVYAKRIQTALLPSDEYINQHLSDCFIMFKPRNIVSGDFYWIKEKNQKLIVVVADCTGHGVPGAFMSMLGISFLNEIVSKEEHFLPNKILNSLRNHIIESLKQKGIDSESRDGMDISLCTIDLKRKELQFAGANNPLYIVRNNELTEIRGDRMPVAIYERMKDFTLHDLEFRKGDMLYMFSDGYPDQFGGEHGKKFKYKPFQQLLMDIHSDDLSQQKIILEKTFEDWKSWIQPGGQEFDQIDDIIVLGMRL